MSHYERAADALAMSKHAAIRQRVNEGDPYPPESWFNLATAAVEALLAITCELSATVGVVGAVAESTERRR